MNSDTIVKAIIAINPNACVSVDSETHLISWLNGTEVIADDIINAKITDMIAKYPMNQLRLIRDDKLASCDYIMFSDYPMALDIKAGWITYRQLLRDLPRSLLGVTLDINNINQYFPSKP